MLTRARPCGDRDERGAVAVVVAVMATMLFVIAAFVVDLGLARDVRRQSQNASDAAALAAANVLYPESGACQSATEPVPPCFQDAVAEARSYSATNFGVQPSAWASCTDTQRYYVPPGQTQCISFTDASLGSTRPTQPTKVRVAMPPSRLESRLGRLAGVASVTISSAARATLGEGQARSCGLCIMGTGVSDLGNGDVTVVGGSVFSNGTIDPGSQGNMTATPTPPNTITTVGQCTQNCSPSAAGGAQPIADPYAGAVTLPIPKGSLTAKTDPCTQGPGIYGALTLPNGTCTLQPGLYFLTGIWDMQSTNTLLKGTGVTLYATCGTTAAPSMCASGASGGGLDGKNGDTQLVAPTTSPAPGVPPGLVIIYDRNNRSPLNLQGNGDSHITGAIYAASAQLEFPGNSFFQVTNGPVIVGSLWGNGNTGGVQLNSVNGAALPAPPSGPSLDQ